MDHPSPSASSLSRTLTVFVIELSICVGLLFAWYTIRPGDTLGDPLSSTTVKSSETPISEEVDLLDTHLDELVLSVAPKENIIIADVVPQSSPGEKYIFELSVRDLEKAEIMKATLLRILESNAYGPLISPITIEITDQRSEPRGRMTLGRVSLIVTIPSESEMIKVFTHELAHVIDLEYLLPGSFSRDPSEIFYDISWIALKTKKK